VVEEVVLVLRGLARVTVVIGRRERHGDVLQRQGDGRRRVELQLVERDQRLVLQHARIDRDGLLRTGYVAAGRIFQRDFFERRAVVIDEGRPLLFDDLHQPGDTEDLIRFAGARAPAHYQLARLEPP